MQGENSQTPAMHSESLDKLAGALAKAQAELTTAKKTAENLFFNSKYADLAACWDVAKKPLANNGLSVSQLPCSSGNQVGVTTYLLHSSGQWLKSEYYLPLVKNTPQAAGSAITYARRYALAAVLGIAQEDDDGNTASTGPTEKEIAQQAAEKAAKVKAKSLDNASNYVVKEGDFAGLKFGDIGLDVVVNEHYPDAENYGFSEKDIKAMEKLAGILAS